ncbi:hypothetical protein LIT32_06775 [Bacillus sp. CMF21]|nr:hypothetical protein LIT32_06775 [Bacillus sp. CMF21]
MSKIYKHASEDLMYKVVFLDEEETEHTEAFGDVADQSEDALEQTEEKIEADFEQKFSRKHREKKSDKKYKEKKYKNKIKKKFKGKEDQKAFGSLYNFDIGGFAIDAAPINFTVEGPEFNTDANPEEDTIHIFKDGNYEITFFMDILANSALANFAIFRNNTQINESKFSFVSEDTIQTTLGKTIHTELEENDVISVRTINTSSPNVGYEPPTIRYLNAALTVKLLNGKDL